VRLIPDMPEIRISLAQALLLQNKCAQTLTVLQEQERLFPYILEIDRLYAVYYQQCEKNPEKAAERDRTYQENTKKYQTNLERF
jgi:hypothetical protein